MAKDYFQDITPPSPSTPDRSDAGAPPQSPPFGAPPSAPEQEDDSNEVRIRVSDGAVPVQRPDGTRGIRSISPPARGRPRVGGDMRGVPPVAPRPPFLSDGAPRPRRYSRTWIWAAAAVSVVVLAALLFIALRPTVVTVTPKSQTATFTEMSRFTAHPAPAAQDALTYTVQASEIDDSEVVPAQGIVHVEEKASGSVTVYNNYSATGVKLVKSTRFQTPDGLVFRVPADVVVPGRSGGAPGRVSVTVIADQAGEKYNVAAGTRFSLPGLKSNAAMYSGVYATSNAAMTGGVLGDQPGMAPGAEDAARAQVRVRLEEKARELGTAKSTADTIVLPAKVTYESLPNTAEAGGGVRIHEKARIEVPVLVASEFARAAARSLAVDADAGALTIVPKQDFSLTGESVSAVLGTDPLLIVASGSAVLVSQVDAAALADALAGRDYQAFETIVKNFTGVSEARARIEPFWKTTFPAASDMKINILAPAAAK